MSVFPFFSQNVLAAEGRRTKRRKWKCKLKKENDQEIVGCFVISLNLQAKNKKCPPEHWGNLPLPLLSQRPAPSEKSRSHGDMPEEEKGTVVWLFGKSIPK